MKKMIFLTVTLMGLLLVAVSSQASDRTHYRPDEISEFTSGNKQGKELLDFVSTLSLRDFHPLGYKRGSKKVMFGSIDLEQDEDGYFVKDVYCNKKIRSNVGPNRIPTNNIMNAEHTWPQSKGSRKEPFRGDLHHLFPTDSRANSTRSSHIFSEVEGRFVSDRDCTASKVGKAISPTTGEATTRSAYQPPVEHRGNVARALFYSAVSYGYEINDLEEHYLKKWHEDDPVDEAEIERHNEIYEAQGNRNPFIDYPEIVDRVSDF